MSAVAKSTEEFNLAAKDLIGRPEPIPSDAEVICIEPDNGSFLAKRRCIVRTSNGRLFVADYNQICYPCSKLNRTCFPKISPTAGGSSVASPTTNLRRAGSICSVLYETVQRETFNVPDALHHVRTAMTYLRDVEAALQNKLKV